MTSTGMSSLAAYWFQFFLDAEIPPSEAGSYAVAFTENRIQRSMMNDLSKDYLNDMGITVMGDIMSILKHAKTVYKQELIGQALKSSNLTQPAAAKTSSHHAASSKPAAAQTSSNHAASSSSSKPAAAQKAAAAQPAKPSHSTAATAAAAVVVRKQVETAAARPKVDVAKSKPATAGATKIDGGTSSSVVRLKQSNIEEVPVKKSRRVFPEHEGPYKITMPAGTTEKTRKLLSLQVDDSPSPTNIRSAEKSSTKTSGKTSLGKSPAQSSKPARDVFSRLGREREEVESISTSSRSPSPEVITDNRTHRQPLSSTAQQKSDGARKPTVAPAITKQVSGGTASTAASIFSRLGGKVAEKRQVSWEEGDGGVDFVLSPSPPKKPFIMVPVTLSKEDRVAKKVQTKIPEQRSDGIFAGGSTLETKSARDRLGGKRSGGGVIADTAQVKTSSALSARLGMKITVSKSGAGNSPAVRSMSGSGMAARLGAVTSTTSVVKSNGVARSGSGGGEDKPVVSSTTQDEPRGRRLGQGTFGGEISRMGNVGIRRNNSETVKSGGKNPPENSGGRVGGLAQRISVGEIGKAGGGGVRISGGEIGRVGGGGQRISGGEAGRLSGVGSGKSSVFSRLGKVTID